MDYIIKDLFFLILSLPRPKSQYLLLSLLFIYDLWYIQYANTNTNIYKLYNITSKHIFWWLITSKHIFINRWEKQYSNSLILINEGQKVTDSTIIGFWNSKKYTKKISIKRKIGRKGPCLEFPCIFYFWLKHWRGRNHSQLSIHVMRCLQFNVSFPVPTHRESTTNNTSFSFCTIVTVPPPPPSIPSHPLDVNQLLVVN